MKAAKEVRFQITCSAISSGRNSGDGTWREAKLGSVERRDVTAYDLRLFFRRKRDWNMFRPGAEYAVSIRRIIPGAADTKAEE